MFGMLHAPGRDLSDMERTSHGEDVAWRGRRMERTSHGGKMRYLMSGKSTSPGKRDYAASRVENGRFDTASQELCDTTRQGYSKPQFVRISVPCRRLRW